MTTAAQAIAVVDELASQLQALVEDGRFVPRFFDRLFGLRTVLGGARERFAADHAARSDESLAYATVRERAEQALALGEDLTPHTAAVARYGRAVDVVIAALSAALLSDPSRP